MNHNEPWRKNYLVARVTEAELPKDEFAIQIVSYQGLI